MDETTEVPIKDLEGKKIPYDVLRYIPEESAVYYKFAPIGLVDGTLEVGMTNPDNVAARDALQFIVSKTNLPFKIFAISQKDFDEILESYKGLRGEVGKALGELDTEIQEAQETKEKLIKKTEHSDVGLVEEAPVTKIVAVILQHATAGGASDIHIEPGTENIKVRFRVDGALFTSLFLPISVLDSIV